MRRPAREARAARGRESSAKDSRRRGARGEFPGTKRTATDRAAPRRRPRPSAETAAADVRRSANRALVRSRSGRGVDGA